ncbi:putative GTPase activating protein for Arf-domain-containing protein [Rhizoctonia solani]|nr:putative GTPase activating protein for Arf-domain-containing protein [Rhizoctonia solani]
MSRQDKQTTERNARTLRELVKRPENKFCADCKKNDARWASWNIGVFVCIRCSGIHRSMGTHISKVKSVDLDVWTPEQMASVQKWGNTRANLYWEAHLKPGHQPADHKIESFIRSKYESRRWAMEGPPPSDPSVLDGSSASVRTIYKNRFEIQGLITLNDSGI